MSNQKSRITIHDIARAADVSVSTVSRVLNGKNDVATETQARVQQIIDEVGYASNLAARSMRSRKTNLLGMIIPDVAESYPIELMKGVNRAIKSQEYDLLIYTSGSSQMNATPAIEQHYVSLMDGGLVDGLLVVAPIASTLKSNSQMVAIDPNVASPDYPAVVATNRIGARAAMDYLIGLGHRRIGYVAGRPELLAAERRLLGYKEGLVKAGIPFDEVLVEVGNFTAESGCQAAYKLLQLPERPTAIFAANDLAAFGVMQAAEELQMRIPQDLSVIGFDNIPESRLCTPPLTTVDQFVAEMGYTATNMLIDLLRGDENDKGVHKIQTKLITRDSCQAV